MEWKVRPASGTRRASMPARLPIQCTSTEASRSRAATARPGLVCPPVPPPAITTSMRRLACGDGYSFRRLDWAIVLYGGPEMASVLPQSAGDRLRAILAAALVLPALEGEGNEAGDQLGVGDARGFPEPRVRAGRREAGDGVDLVHEHAAVALDEEVDPRHPRAVGGPEGPERERPHLLGHLGRQRRGDLERGLPGAVLGVVVVPLAREGDLARHRDLGLVVAEHRHLHLAALDPALDDDPPVVPPGQIDGGGEILGSLDLADADARAQVGRLDEAGEADLAADTARDRAGLPPPVVPTHRGVLDDRKIVGAEEVLHRDLVHADRGGEHAGAGVGDAGQLQ